MEKERHKYAQTGDKCAITSIEEAEKCAMPTIQEAVLATEDKCTIPAVETAEPQNTCLPQPEDQLELLFTSEMQDVLELNAHDAKCLSVNYGALCDSSSSPVGQDNSSDYESGPDISLDDLHGMHLADLWDNTAPQTAAAADWPCSSNTVPANTGTGFRSIWSCGTDNDLPSLPASYTGSQSIAYPFDTLVEEEADVLPSLPASNTGAQSYLFDTLVEEGEGDLPMWNTEQHDAAAVVVSGNTSENEEYQASSDWQIKPADVTPTNLHATKQVSIRWPG